MFGDFQFIVLWWFVLLVFGVIGFPLTFRLFSGFADRGYALAKAVGILLVSYILFLLAHTKVVTIDSLPISLAMGIVFAASLGLEKLFKSRENQGESPSTMRNFFRRRWKIIILEELMFFVTLWFWSVIRAFAPEIHGLEKFMDFGFMQSILTNKTLPPLDMWLTQAPDYPGHFINYYYFGHYIAAVLTRISGILPEITYNLMIATTFAFTYTMSFSIGMNLFYLFLKKSGQQIISLRKPVVVGFLAAFLVSLAGNLHTIYLFTTGYPNEEPIPFWKILSIYNPTAYWYPNATRFIPYTIHEFPIYSYVVADLHGHVSDIPFVLLTMALLLSIITSNDKKVKPARHEKNPNDKAQMTNQAQGSKFKFSNSFAHFDFGFDLTFGFRILFIGLLISVMYMTNAWDGIIYFILSGLVLLYLNFKSSETKRDSTAILLQTFFQGLILVFCFILFTLPFSLNFKPFVSGFGVVCPPQAFVGRSLGPFIFEEGDKCARSPLWMMFVLWGFFLYTAIGFLTFILLPKFRERIGSWGERLSAISPVDIFIALITAISAFLIIFPEFFYAKDIYPLHYRANTMFKLGYQAFMMMQLASAYIFFRILTARMHGETLMAKAKFAVIALPRVLWIFGFFFLFYLVSIYPYFAIMSYYGNLKYYKSLNGLTWLEQQYPEDFKGIQWLRAQTGKCNNNLQPCPQPVVLESVGESYTDYARVSANTGLPTVVGWPVHEWLWRGSYDEPGKRIPLVERMYISMDSNEVVGLLRKYNVTYVFVGALERQKYPKLTEDVFKEIGSVVFESGDTRIYKVNTQ